MASDGHGADIFYSFAADFLNSFRGPTWFSHDRQFFYVKDRRSKKLLLEIPKYSTKLFGEILAGHVVRSLRGGIAPIVNHDIIDAALERHRRAENRRIRANLRYERNHVVTR